MLLPGQAAVLVLKRDSEYPHSYQVMIRTAIDAEYPGPILISQGALQTGDLCEITTLDAALEYSARALRCYVRSRPFERLVPTHGGCYDRIP